MSATQPYPKANGKSKAKQEPETIRLPEWKPTAPTPTQPIHRPEERDGAGADGTEFSFLRLQANSPGTVSAAQPHAKANSSQKANAEPGAVRLPE